MDFSPTTTKAGKWRTGSMRMGITAFVLRYRLGPRYHHPDRTGRRAESDPPGAQPGRGIRRSRPIALESWASRRAAIWLRRPRLTSTAAILRPQTRSIAPAAVLILPFSVIPVISFVSPYAHAGSAKNLLGDNPDPKLLEELSNELHVTPQTPPTFLFTTSEDDGCAAGKQRELLSGAAQGRGSSRNACLREGSARSWS